MFVQSIVHIVQALLMIDAKYGSRGSMRFCERNIFTFWEFHFRFFDCFSGMTSKLGRDTNDVSELI